MIYAILKIGISAILIVVVSEIAKRSSLLGAVFASIPLVSVLAMIWLYQDTKNLEQISLLSKNIFWLVLPSLVLFITLPIFIKIGWSFYGALMSGLCLTILAYFLMIWILKNSGISL